MEKILKPADKVLTEIGRLVLAKPLFSGVLLISAIAITVFTNSMTAEDNRFIEPAAPVVSLPIVSPPSLPITNTAVTSEPSVSSSDLVPAPVSANKSIPATDKKTAKTTADNTQSSSLHYISGRIKKSLTADARKAGLSAKQVNQLVQIFSAKNAGQKVRVGDEFHVLYEDALKKGTKKSTGNILAAQLVTDDKTYQLIRFTDPKGHTEYYTPQGQSLRDGILRRPMAGRINSGFSRNRLDPVLGFYRPHLGIDFGAPYGSPVTASGDGVLAEMGYKGGYGKAVVIQHDGKYSTLYAHLSKFGRVHAGQAVHKGQIIGYVGQTGFATGPHLHYEIRVNDVPFNPLTVALPGASIPKIYRNQFLLRSRMLLAQLNTNKRQQVRLAQRADPTSAKRS